MSSSIGKLFVVTTFGESHGLSVGALVDGCPAGLSLSEEDIQPQLSRRRPGQSELTTARDEADTVTILSGVEDGVTIGSPIALAVNNDDKRANDYGHLTGIPRPSHADFSYKMKYGVTASSGGGRASARETIGRVSAGAIAEKVLRTRYGVEIVGWVSAVSSIKAADMTGSNFDRSTVDQTAVRCPDSEVAAEMAAAIEEAKNDGDSLGGVVTCVCRNVPTGWGEPVFDKASALLGRAMLSIPAVKGFEIGSGFAGTRMRGSEHNDLFVRKGDTIGAATNRSGGLQGGITNGEPIIFNVAFKPVASIGKVQQTVGYDGKEAKLEGKGRHDPCVLPRAVPVVESMASLVLVDLALRAGVVINER